jgi:hypothetical protein
MTSTSRLRTASHAMQILGAVALILGWSGTAAAKKKKLKMESPSASEPAVPAGPVAPEPDSQGHVNFGNPTADNVGRVSVKGTPGVKIQVYLDGRYFGDAPVTVYSVPAGDYIVEGTVVDSGKQLSRPVSVTANEEATVELGAGKIETPVATAAAMPGELSPQRMRLVKISLIAGAVTLAVGITFGILEMKAESDYEKTPVSNQAKLDDLSSSGKRDALLSNVGFALAGVSLAVAAVAAYPLFIKPNPEKAQNQTAFFVAPVLAGGTAGGVLSLRF